MKIAVNHAKKGVSTTKDRERKTSSHAPSSNATSAVGSQESSIADTRIGSLRITIATSVIATTGGGNERERE